MKRQSLTLSFLLLTTSLVHAESGAEKAFAESIKDLNQSGLFSVEVGSTHYQEDGDILTAQNVTYKLDWAIPAELAKLDSKDERDSEGDKAGDMDAPDTNEEEAHITLTLTVPTLTTTGLRLELDGVSYDQMIYEGQQILAKVDMPGTANDATIKATALGKDVMENGYQPFLGEFKIAPARPIGSVLDYIRPLLLKPVIGKYASAGYATTQITGDGTITEESEMGPLAMSDLRDGKIATYEIAYQKGKMPLRDMMMAQSKAGSGDATAAGSGLEKMPEALTYEFGKTTYTGYDIAAIWAAVDPNAPKPADPATILTEARIGPIKLTASDMFELTVEPSVMKDYRLKQPQTFIVPLLDKRIANDQDREDLPVEEQQKLFRAGFDIVRGISLGMSENGAIRFSGTIPAGQFKGQTFNGGIGKIRLSNLSAKGMEEVSLSDLTYSGPPSVSLSIGHMALENLEFADYEQIEDVFVRSISGGEPTSAQVAKSAPESYDIAIKDLSYQDAMSNTVSLKSFQTGMKRKGLAIPALFTSKIDELKISKSLLAHPLLSVLMSQLKLEELTVNEDITVAWDEKSESVTIDPLNIELLQIAKLSGNLGFGGIVRDYLDNPEMAQAAMMTGTILPSNLTLGDLGGLNNLIDLAGVTAGMGPDQVREFASSQVQATLSAFTKPYFAQMVGGEIRQFLTDPQTLKIVLNPGSPVPVMQVMGALSQDPGVIPDLLNIGVTANEK